MLTLLSHVESAYMVGTTSDVPVGFPAPDVTIAAGPLVVARNRRRMGRQPRGTEERKERNNGKVNAGTNWSSA